MNTIIAVTILERINDDTTSGGGSENELHTDNPENQVILTDDGDVLTMDN